MRIKPYLQFLLAARAAKANALAMDGGPTTNYNGFVDMEAHDRRFHHGHYEEGQTCKLRDMLGRRDVIDMIAPENRDTTREQVESVMASAQESGLLDEADHRALVDEFEAIRDAVEGLDEMDESEMMPWAQRMRDFNAVYNSLAAMNSESEPEPASAPEPEPAPAAEPESPTPEPTPAPEPEPAASPTSPAPDPSPAETPPPGNLARETTAAGNFVYPSLGRGGRWRGYDEINRLMNLRNTNYEWPVQSRNGRITADQITPELVEAVAAHQKFRARNSWTIAQRIDSVMNVISNPAACENSWRYTKAFNLLEQGGRRGATPEKRHLRQIFDALHPGYMEHREERIRAAREEADRAREAAEQERLRQQVQNLENAAQAARNDGTLREGVARRVNFTEDDAADAVNQLVSRLGEQYRQQVQGAIDTFQRTGNIPRNSIDYLNQALSPDHPVRRAINEAANREAIERNRLWNSVALDESTTNNLRDLANRTGVRFVPGGIATEGGHSNGYNCYHAALVYGMRRAGLDMPFKYRPVGYANSSQEYFLPMKQAMADAGWDRINGRTHEETVANLERLAREKPEGYTLELWSSGHHGTSAFLHDGQWYWYDVYGGSRRGPYTSSDIASGIADLPEGNVHEMDDRQRRLMSMAIRRGIPIERRQELQRTGQLDAYIEEKMRDSGRVAEATFGHNAGDYSEELIRQALRD